MTSSNVNYTNRKQFENLDPTNVNECIVSQSTDLVDETLLELDEKKGLSSER